jgi:tetratricopeptide (TPR) repeat protein
MLISCSSYREISLEGKYKTSDFNYKNPYYVIIHSPEYKEKSAEKTVHYSRIKYLSVKYGDKNLDLILQRSYKEIKNKNYHSAAILLQDAAEIWQNGAAENNLAVIYELTGKKNLAFEMYTKALLLSPDNKIFKKNFLSFINRRDPVF